MSNSEENQPKRLFDYEAVYLSQKLNFDMNEYLQHPYMIKVLHEEKEFFVAHSIKMEEILDDKTYKYTRLEIETKEINIKLEGARSEIEKLEKEKKTLNSSIKDKDKQVVHLQSEKHKMEIELTRVKEKLEEVNRNSILQFIITSMATVLLGFGVNIVTTTLNNWIGWMLIVVSLVLAISAFILVRKGK